MHSKDHYLLGVQWEGTAYINRVLPFGLSSATKISSVVADAIQWILHNKGINKGLHYLDNYILVAGSFHTAGHQQDTLLATFEKLKVPIEPSNLEDPSACLSYLGVEI